MWFVYSDVFFFFEDDVLKCVLSSSAIYQMDLEHEHEPLNLSKDLFFCAVKHKCLVYLFP